MNFVALRDELLTDALARGYFGMTDTVSKHIIE